MFSKLAISFPDTASIFNYLSIKVLHVIRQVPMMVLLICLLLACTDKPTGESGGASEALPDYMWVELGPNDSILARAIMSEESCPNVIIDDNSFLMQPRTVNAPMGFENVRVCEYPIPSGANAAEVNGRPFALPKAQPQRIVVVGDTGCRVEKDNIQNCTGQGEGTPWRFDELAAEISAVDPDLIIHVGDYHYREIGTCDERCDQSNIGDNWASWQADFFDPAQTILSQAPWVFIRGNHEECDRAWLGWFYLLDPYPLPDNPWDTENCQNFTDPYRVPTGGQNILIFDNSAIPDDYAATPEPTAVARYTEEFNQLEELTSDQTPVWLVSHRPIWGVAGYLDSSGNPAIDFTDLTLQQALNGSTQQELPSPPIDMILAGHIHFFEMLIFTDGRPPQFVFGGGSTKLDSGISDDLLNSAAGQSVLTELNVTKDMLTIIEGISFGLIEVQDDGWNVTIKDVDGNDLRTIFVGENE